jgi:hypothetical protein
MPFFLSYWLNAVGFFDDEEAANERYSDTEGGDPCRNG